MFIHKSKSPDVIKFVYFDDNERVVELPTKFIFFLSSTKKKSIHTLNLYANRLRDFCLYLELDKVFGRCTVDQALEMLKLMVVDEFYKTLFDRGMAASTVRGYESVLKLFFDWLASESAGRIHEKSLYHNSGSRTPKPSQRMPRYLLPDQVIQLLKGMRWESQRLITHLMYDTGVRVSEVPRILKGDIPNPDHFPEELDFFPLLIRGSKGKGGEYKERQTFISKPLLVRLHRYFRSKAYIFADQWPDESKPALLNIYGEHISVKAIQKFISDAANRANIKFKVSPHRLRHGTAISVLRGMGNGSFLDSLIHLRNMLGHSSIQTTEIYIHIEAPVFKKIRDASQNKGLISRIAESENIFQETYITERNLPVKKRIGVRVE